MAKKLTPIVKQLLGSLKMDKNKIEKISDERFEHLKGKYLGVF